MAIRVQHQVETVAAFPRYATLSGPRGSRGGREADGSVAIGAMRPSWPAIGERSDAGAGLEGFEPSSLDSKSNSISKLAHRPVCFA